MNKQLFRYNWKNKEWERLYQIPHPNVPYIDLNFNRIRVMNEIHNRQAR